MLTGGAVVILGVGAVIADPTHFLRVDEKKQSNLESLLPSEALQVWMLLRLLSASKRLESSLCSTKN